ncbi:hypothetical protein Leryth_026367 [Lithospermum erythrorhizon]|nr:hypothetical protein Leryth_026367 [Lithospermum erythrorhizon]
MKLVWSPETALKAYLDTVKSCELFNESSVAEFISAMAAGWNAQLIVETWSRGGSIETSVGLAIARNHTGARHICLVTDEESRIQYEQALENSRVCPGETIIIKPDDDEEAAMEGLKGVDFLVVDSSRGNEFERIFRVAKLGNRGAVLMCKNANSRDPDSGFRWKNVVAGKSRIVRSMILPVGKGLDIAHVGATPAGGRSMLGKPGRRWINFFDHQSGEEYVFRR